MLTDLIIKNFAIIDRLHVTFQGGFNVLTGETGAGKSIIIDAVGLLMGDRARPEVIRTGEDEAQVEAMFNISGRSGIIQRLEAEGFEAGDELIIKRLVSRSGKNRIYINGSLAKLAQLEEVASELVTIYGQHEHQNLQRSDTHLDLLDRYANLQEDVARYRDLYRATQELEHNRKKLEEAEKERQQRLDLLTFQSREIDRAQLQPGEEESLASERLRLQHAEKVVAATEGGHELLYDMEGSVCEKLGLLADQLEGLREVDPRLGTLGEAVRNAFYGLEDVALQLREHAGQGGYEEGRQDQVEQRLALLAGLKRKYGTNIDEILAFKEKVDHEVEILKDIDATREVLDKKLTASRARLQEAGQQLSEARRSAGEKLREALEKELKELAMEKARFEMRLFPLAAPGPKGLERGEFYISANPGEEPKPLAWIASGGELSRIMLALKSVAPERDGVSTLVFDEVDAGVGGMAATAVGEKLRRVAQGLQVLCITHLPQVAAFGDRHYRVEKMQQSGRTFTALVPLEGEERVREMARMLGGAQVTEKTLAHAREMITSSAKG
ncbi:DNA repair protein RecN [Desulfuromonas sp. AOP6]|uniref:DNA repair protein RecN n=1 Tax=Desulfuromonas sp. AOP6 TaxID=1566351 RepID=UPI001279A542|nr:DNA repair protein RecN [Desulfuromonas sp. AOP6]BCA80284.1 DNA repair protein RecN [Desulfuromonas sp. AOP6]